MPNDGIYQHAANGLAGFRQMGDTRLEHPGDSPKKTGIPQKGAAKSAALSSDFAPDGADLAEVVNAWPTLPEAIKAGILATVRAVTNPG